MSNRVTTDQIRAMKGREKIAALTAYVEPAIALQAVKDAWAI